MNVRTTQDIRSMSLEQTFETLESSVTGLSSGQATERASRYGLNEIEEEKGNWLKEIMSRFWGPMPWLLELTIALSLLLGRIADGLIVFVLLIMNVGLGTLRADRSKRAVELLKAKLTVSVMVLRDRKWDRVAAKHIVPGDVVSLGLGDMVPADAKVVSGEVIVDQSALTGESIPVTVGAGGVLFSSSAVLRGQSIAVVVNTGLNTYFGKTAQLVKTAKPESHQEKIILSLTRTLLLVSILALAITSMYAWMTGGGLIVVVNLAVMFLLGSVPVALPAVLTTIQSVVSSQMADKGILVSRLDSVEDAAMIDVVCLDKTGTITENRLSVTEIIPIPGRTPEEVITVAALACPTGSDAILDTIITEYVNSHDIDLSPFKRIEETPFNPQLRRSESVVEKDGAVFRAVKGAADMILGMSTGITVQEQAKMREVIEGLSGRGLRTLGVAQSSPNQSYNLHFVGVLAFSDPLRPESRETIEELRSSGVTTILLTGDNQRIAREIAKEASIGDRIVLMHEYLEAEKEHRDPTCYDGYAEVYPEDKFHIVKDLQEHGHMVGMTGDGVNDAPALKQAELGIALSNATDIAKAAASAVLTTDGVHVITSAIRSGREAYQKLLTWVLNKVAKTVQVVGVLTLGYLWMNDLVVEISGMVLLVFSNDFATLSLATDPEGATPRPVRWKVRNVAAVGASVGALLILQGGLAILMGTRFLGLTLDQLRTFVLLVLIFTSQFRVLVLRERRWFWSSEPGRELKFSIALVTIVFFVVGILGVVVEPLPISDVMLALVFSLLFTLVVVDPVKRAAIRVFSL